MKISITFWAIMVSLSFSSTAIGQIDEDKMGIWNMYFWNTDFKESGWGAQGDIQYRSWNIIGDLEQLLLRGGITYVPNGANIKFTLGYANITTGEYGDDDSTFGENRIYQEALFPGKIGQRFYLNHRFRYEQRYVESQDFRTRFRYNFFLNVALNSTEMTAKTIYLALYNEIFINGERKIGEDNGVDRTVELFDRNRFYAAIGYILKNNLRIQFGIMQQTTDDGMKNQIQLSLHHKI